MIDIAYQRCFNHGDREASAKCLQCGHFFCRECATEHEDRVICSQCLSKLTAPKEKKRWLSLPVILQVHAGIIGAIVLWLFFFAVGQALLSVPDAYHRKRSWREKVDRFIEMLREEP